MRINLHDQKNKIWGDFELESPPNADLITPVPRWVGPMTEAMLLQNNIGSAYRYLLEFDIDKFWNLTKLPLDIQAPVATDIKIAKTHKLKKNAKFAIEI